MISKEKWALKPFFNKLSKKTRQHMLLLFPDGLLPPILSYLISKVSELISQKVNETLETVQDFLYKLGMKPHGSHNFFTKIHSLSKQFCTRILFS